MTRISCALLIVLFTAISAVSQTKTSDNGWPRKFAIGTNSVAVYQPQIEESARVVGLLVVVTLAFIFLVKPMMAKVSAGVATTRVAVAAAGNRPRTVAELEGEIAAQLDAAETKGDRKLPVLTKRVADTSLKEPEHVAKVLRSWMKEEVR